MNEIKNPPKVSVIFPFFNAKKTLIRAISSIKTQSLENWECLLVNNNSDDGSSEIASRYVMQDKRFKLINETRQGVVFASQKGFTLAKGKYICRMDADDVSLPNRLKDQSAFLDNNPHCDVISGLVDYVAHRKGTLGFQRFVDWVNSVQTYKDIFNKRFIESPIVNPSAMWRREVVDKFGFYREGDFPEDYELWLRWLDREVKIQKLPYKILEWYDSDDRLTRSDKRYRDKAFYLIKTKYLSKWLKVNNPFHPLVAVWGASRISRLRAGLLEQHGINISYYIDISLKRVLDKKVVNYKNIPNPGQVFILTYIRQTDARNKVRSYLESEGYVEGGNFLMIS